MTNIRFFGKRPLSIAAMKVELPAFKNGEHNSEKASTLDRDITPLNRVPRGACIEQQTCLNQSPQPAPIGKTSCRL